MATAILSKTSHSFDQECMNSFNTDTQRLLNDLAAAGTDRVRIKTISRQLKPILGEHLGNYDRLTLTLQSHRGVVSKNGREVRIKYTDIQGVSRYLDLYIG